MAEQLEALDVILIILHDRIAYTTAMNEATISSKSDYDEWMKKNSTLFARMEAHGAAIEFISPTLKGSQIEALEESEEIMQKARSRFEIDCSGIVIIN